MEALEELPDDQRRVVELRTLDGLPWREVGEHMERGAEAARLLHYRALLRLGRLLERRSL